MALVFMESEGKRRVIRIAVWVAVIAMVLAVVSSLAFAADASAHAVLKSMTPAAGSTVRQAPDAVVLQFNEPISSRFATVAVTGPAGAPAASGKPSVSGATVAQPLAAGLVSGGYTVAFRVVSEDGHPVSSKGSFTLALPAATTTTSPGSGAVTPTTRPSASSPSAATTPESMPAAGAPSEATGGSEGGSFSGPTWVIFGIGILIAMGLAFGLTKRGQKRS